jgi:hypothetical protein
MLGGYLDSSSTELFINQGEVGYYFSAVLSLTNIPISLRFNNTEVYLDNTVLRAYGASLRFIIEDESLII